MKEKLDLNLCSKVFEGVNTLADKKETFTTYDISKETNISLDTLNKHKYLILNDIFEAKFEITSGVIIKKNLKLISPKKKCYEILKELGIESEYIFVSIFKKNHKTRR